MISIALSILTVLCVATLFLDTTNFITLFWQPKSFFLVVFFTLSATFLQFPLNQCASVFRWLYVSFRSSPINFNQDIKRMCELADSIKVDGVQSLKDEIKTNKNHFLAKSLTLVMDQCQTSELKTICQETISAIEKRHQTAIFFFEQMGKYAPGFGLLGTVVGLIQLLSTLDSPDQLGQGMALALVTTFYGILLANLLFQPIAGRLYALSHYEQRHNEMLMIGILELAQGSPALLIKEKMMMVVNNQRTNG